MWFEIIFSIVVAVFVAFKIKSDIKYYNRLKNAGCLFRSKCDPRFSEATLKLEEDKIKDDDRRFNNLCEYLDSMLSCYNDDEFRKIIYKSIADNYYFPHTDYKEFVNNIMCNLFHTKDNIINPNKRYNIDSHLYTTNKADELKLLIDFIGELWNFYELYKDNHYVVCDYYDNEPIIPYSENSKLSIYFYDKINE